MKQVRIICAAVLQYSSSFIYEPLTHTTYIVYTCIYVKYSGPNLSITYHLHVFVKFECLYTIEFFKMYIIYCVYSKTFKKENNIESEISN